MVVGDWWIETVQFMWNWCYRWVYAGWVVGGWWLVIGGLRPSSSCGAGATGGVAGGWLVDDWLMVGGCLMVDG